MSLVSYPKKLDMFCIKKMMRIYLFFPNARWTQLIVLSVQFFYRRPLDLTSYFTKTIVHWIKGLFFFAVYISLPFMGQFFCVTVMLLTLLCETEAQHNSLWHWFSSWAFRHNGQLSDCEQWKSIVPSEAAGCDQWFSYTDTQTSHTGLWCFKANMNTDNSVK